MGLGVVVYARFWGAAWLSEQGPALPPGVLYHPWDAATPLSCPCCPCLQAECVEAFLAATLSRMHHLDGAMLRLQPLVGQLVEDSECRGLAVG